MKTIIFLFFVLAMFGIVYAQTTADASVTENDTDITSEITSMNATMGITRHDEALGPLDVIIDIDEQQGINEVAVCTTPEKDDGYVIASVSSSALVSEALDAAENLFNGLDGNETEDVLGSRHFGCLRERLANETNATGVAATNATTTGTATGNVTGTQTGTATGTPVQTTGTATGGGGVTY